MAALGRPAAAFDAVTASNAPRSSRARVTPAITIYDTFGTQNHTAEELAGLLAPLLGVVFVERDS
ncbi:hypothetical protein ACN9M0_02545 [Streptomyces sp. R-07]|uniref:hypothetical protein n=1 Tax=Streptomyces sp. R-07 TaxID=3404052 RepID=UPI003CF7EC17